ncbi:MAG: ABC transporter ATP-binding protein [Dongiaceae bacterium]
MLEITGVGKRFANGVAALDGIDLAVERGAIVGLVGTSGCGKSTLLRLVGGLDRPSAGRVLLDGTPVQGPRPEVGIVFQEPRLMPWLDVAGNVRFGLDGLPRATRDALAAAALAKVGLTRFAAALPRELSGGMAQRVALARALVTQPQLLLLDEPFSALDAFIRLRLQDELLKLWAIDRPTLLFVTHDIEEALALADRVVVLRGHPGRVHRDYRIELPRPRRRTEAAFQRWKERLLDDLDLSAAA